MMISKDDEIRRSRLWRIVIIVSSILIIIIAIFFLMRLFTMNPLEGCWKSEDGDFLLVIGSNGEMSVNIADVAGAEDVNVKMSYTMDKDAKTITIREDTAEVDRLAEESDGAYTRETIENALSGILTTFDYSVDNEYLTLAEREYGEQLTFIRN